MNKELVELGVTDAALAELKAEWATVPDCSTRAGYNLATTGIADLRKKRGQVEKRRKELKKPIIERGKLIEAEAKRITAALMEVETPLKDAKQAEDNRLDMIRVEEERKEAERQQRITDKINGFKGLIAKGAGADSKTLGEMLNSLRDIDNSDCDERKEQADAILSETVNGLTQLREQAELAEEYRRRQKEIAEEEAKQAAERAKLDAEKADMEAKKAREASLKKAAQEKAEMEAKRAHEESLKKATEEKEEESVFKDAPGGFGRGSAFDRQTEPVDFRPGAIKVTPADPRAYIETVNQVADRLEITEDNAALLVDDIISGKFKWIKWIG